VSIFLVHLAETLDGAVACHLALVEMVRSFVTLNLVRGCTSQSGISTDCQSSTNSSIMNIQQLPTAHLWDVMLFGWFVTWM